jgi:Na+/H+ antiporter NhaC
MAAGSDHIDHVNTQLPYALLIAGMSSILFLVAGLLM